MTERETAMSDWWSNKTLIIAVVVVVVVVICLYFRDQQQRRDYELRRLERRVELLEEWGRPQQNAPRQQQQAW